MVSCFLIAPWWPTKAIYFYYLFSITSVYKFMINLPRKKSNINDMGFGWIAMSWFEYSRILVQHQVNNNTTQNYTVRYFIWHSNGKCGIYRQVSNIRRTLVGNKIVDHSDVVGASPVVLDLAPGFIGLGKDNCKKRRETFKFGVWVRLILEILQYIRLSTHKDIPSHDWTTYSVMLLWPNQSSHLTQ